MKKQIYILVILAQSVLYYGCQKEPVTETLNGRGIVIEAAIAQTKATPSTDLAGGEFEVGDELGFYLKGKNGYHSGNTNAKYVASEITQEDSEVKTMVFTSTAPLFYYDYDLHNIYGYYPYVAGTQTAAAVDFVVKADQRGTVSEGGLSNYTLSDLMWASKEDVQPQTQFEEKISLVFNHTLSNIIVTIKNRTGAPFSGAVPVVKLRDVIDKVSLDVETGAATADVTSHHDIQMVPYECVPKGDYQDGVTTEIHYRAIAVPQSFAKEASVLKVTTNGVTYQVKTTNALTFETGKQHQLDVTNTGVDFRLSSCSVAEWGSKVEVDGGTVGGDGVLPCTMLFTVKGAKAANVAKVLLKLNTSGETYIDATAVDLNGELLKVTYEQGHAWAATLVDVKFLDSSNNELDSDVKGETLNWNIVGDPTDVAYDKVVGKVTFN